MGVLVAGRNLVRVLASKSGGGTNNVMQIRSSNISGKAYRDPSFKRPTPFPYKEKKYSLLRSLLDRTTSRFDENTKIIVVEGPVGSGKTEVAKELAQELDMLHIAEATMDLRYINPYGYDLRNLDRRLPESVQSFDETKFCLDPTHLNVAAFQLWKYVLRFSQYIDALAHLLNTGQGVVLERSPWSDMVFVEAMRKHNYISKGAHKAYWMVRDNTINQLLRPHLILYLDIPVKRVMEKIKQRNHPHEVNGKALTESYLRDMESEYKTKYLKDISTHSELLIYDWSDGGDVEVIVEDIERIDFDKYSKNDAKLSDWRKGKEQIWADTRMRYTNEKDELMSLFNIPTLSAPELYADGEDVRTWNLVVQSAPGMEYQPGFNTGQGDTGLLWKTKQSKHTFY